MGYTEKIEEAQVAVVGAGPGNPDLITVLGRKLIENADAVIYAGSLVSDEHLKFMKEGAVSYNSAKMNLDEVMDTVKKHTGKNEKVVRLHTGDPSIYGAIKEQMDKMEEMGITYAVVPGVSSFSASCAQLREEFTLPDVSQTVILTRMKGRTGVPETEDLEKLASYKASMSIFLSVGMIEDVAEKLKKGYGSDEVPCAVVYKATWEDEKIIRCTLKDLASKVKEAGIKMTAQILVGWFLDSEYSLSKLYDSEFTTGFRKGTKSE